MSLNMWNGSALDWTPVSRGVWYQGSHVFPGDPASLHQSKYIDWGKDNAVIFLLIVWFLTTVVIIVAGFLQIVYTTFIIIIPVLLITVLLVQICQTYMKPVTYFLACMAYMVLCWAVLFSTLVILSTELTCWSCLSVSLVNSIDALCIYVKNGCKHDPSNYWGIALLSCVIGR